MGNSLTHPESSKANREHCVKIWAKTSPEKTKVKNLPDNKSSGWSINWEIPRQKQLHQVNIIK
jgi:hypothetical protein